MLAVANNDERLRFVGALYDFLFSLKMEALASI